MRRPRENKTLTRAEMEIMNFLWGMEAGGGTVRNVLECYSEPTPAYTTTATFLKILARKGFVTIEKIDGGGKMFFFRPTMTKDEYRKQALDDVKNNFFGGSVKSLVSFFVKEESISEEELKELMEMVNSENS